MRLTRSGLVLVLVLLAAANVLVYRALAAPEALRISVLTAGKERAVLLRSPSGDSVLVGAGGDASILRALGTVLPAWQRRLTVVVLPAMTPSGAGGVPEVLERYRADYLLRPDTRGSRALESALTDAARALPGLSVLSAGAGTRVRLTDGVTLDLAPEPGGTLGVQASYGAVSLALSTTTPSGAYYANGAFVPR